MLRVLNTRDGQFVVTLGHDYVKRALLSSPMDTQNFDLQDATPTTFAIFDNTLAIGCHDGSVKLYDIERLEYLRDVFSGTTPIFSMKFNHDGSRLGVAAHDKTALVPVTKITEITIIDIPARYISWCRRDENLLAITGQDSNAYLYNIGSGKVISEINGVLPRVTLEDTRLAHAMFSPSGDVLALPTKSMDIVIYDCNQCLEQTRMCQQDLTIDAKWSPNGRYIASILGNNKLFIWHVGSRRAVTIETLEAPCSNLDWNHHENELTVISSKDASIFKVVPVPEEQDTPLGPPVEHRAEVDLQVQRDRTRKDHQQELIVSEDAIDIGSGDEEEGDSLNELYEEPIQQEKVLEELEMEADDPFEDYRAAKRVRLDTDDARAFQSGSTPWMNRKRIMCTNYVGYVWATYQDNEHNTVSVAFFDQGDHRDYHFEDENKYDIAAMGKKATILAKTTTGKMLVRLHDSRIDSWEHDCQQPLRSVAISDKLVVVCTEFGVVYTYSLYGNPISVSRESRDPVLTCAANDNILVTVRSGFSGPCYTIEDVMTQRYYQKNDPLDVGPHVRLKSLFFNDNGDPCMADSDHIISTLTHWREPGQARWVPIFSSNELSKQEGRPVRCWPIGIFDRQLLCVRLKDKKLHPVVPIPVTSLIDLKIPGVQDEHEAGYLLHRTLHTQYSTRAEALISQNQTVPEQLGELTSSMEHNFNINLLKQFQSACAVSLPNRCLAVASLMTTEEVLGVAAQIASRFNLHSVVERIQN